MKKLRVIAMADRQEELLKGLLRLGCLEISEPDEKLSDPAWSALLQRETSGLSATKGEIGDVNTALAAIRRYAQLKDGIFIKRHPISEKEFLGSGTVEQARKVSEAVGQQLQTLTRLGLVPALGGRYFEQQAALTNNDSGVFRDDWVTLKADPCSPCVFTRGVDLLRLPIRHGEGKFVAEGSVIEELERKHLAALRYSTAAGDSAPGFPGNPNGSIHDIAGVCDESGRIFGLMPHPEAFLSPLNAPDWQKRKLEGTLPEWGEGRIIFRNAVDFAAENLL